MDIQQKKIDSLIPDDHNFNQGTEYGQHLIEKSLAEFGAGRGILLDKNGRIIAGNKTVENAAAIGMDDVIIVPTDGTKIVATMRTDIDLDSERGRAMALADNASGAANLKWDQKELQAAQEKWNLPVDDWGVGMSEAEEAFEDATAEEDGFDETEEVETRCKLGDVWHLGRHRLMCGDSTRAADVEKLMNGEQADLWLTDPPYNVDYEGGQGLKIVNDHQEDSAFYKFLTSAFQAARDVMKPGAAFYVWTAQGHNLTTFSNALDDVGLQWRQQLIWKKNALVLGHSDYQYIHEPCLYGWKEGAGHYFAPTRTETTVIPDANELDLEKMTKDEMKALLEMIYSEALPTTVMNENKPTKSTDHPTMKPVRLFGRQIVNSSKIGDIVLDSFGGSGTTIVACEQLGRKARLMEFDPHYCDVIISRYEKLTGTPAVKL